MDELRPVYLSRLRDRYRKADLEVLLPPDQDTHPAMSLDEVFVPQLVRDNPPPFELLNLPREALLRLSEDHQLAELPMQLDRRRLEEARRLYEERPARPILDALAASQRAVVLGDPGAGKSTLARFAVLALASAELDSTPVAIPSAWQGCLPVLIELRTCAEPFGRGRTFLELVDDLYRTEHVGLPKSRLAGYLADGGPALVVFDGLDEIFDPGVRHEVTRRIEGFAARYPTARIIVTSRVVGYSRAKLDAAGFDTLMLQDLDSEQIKSFAELWYARSLPDDRTEADRRRARLLEAVETSGAIAELAGNPMLLTILAIMARRREIPRDRRMVYEYAVSVLVQHWDVNKFLREQDEDVSHLDECDKLQMLRRVARRMQDGPAGLAGNHLHSSALIDEFEAYLTAELGLAKDRALRVARTMLSQFHHRNFILSSFGAGMFGFVHRAFLEYLAASDVNDRLTNRTLSDDELFAVFDVRCLDAAWTEVLLLLVGMIPESLAVAVLKRLPEQDPYWKLRGTLPRARILVLRAVGEIRGRSALVSLAPWMTDFVIDTIETADRIPPSSDAVLALAEFARQLPNSNRPVAWLDRQRYDAWYRGRGYLAIAFREPCARLFCAVHGGSADSLRELALHGPTPTVRSAAVDALAREWLDDPDTRTRLFGWLTDAEPVLRDAALKGLASRGAIPADTLRGLAVDGDPALRIGALRAMAVDAANDVTTVAFLLDRARLDDEWHCRVTAAETLAQARGGDPEVFSFLRGRVMAERLEMARSAIVAAIGHGWTSDDRTLPFLRECVDNAGPQSRVRSRAVAEIGQSWSGDPETLAWLHKIAVDDHDELVRWSAMHSVWQCRPGDPATRALLFDRAVGDAGEDVRRSAVRLIVQSWAEDDGLLEWLCDRVARDGSERVQSAVIRAVGSELPRGPETVTTLQEWAVGCAAAHGRRAALQALAQGWPDHPATVPLLLDRAQKDPADTVRTEARQLLALYPASR